MEREITDCNGVTGTCVQAYSALDNNAENPEAAQVNQLQQLANSITTTQ